MDDVTGTVVPHQSVRLVEWRQVCEKGREHLVELKSFKSWLNSKIIVSPSC